MGSLEVLEMLQQSLAGSLVAAYQAPSPPSEPVRRAASIRAYCEGRCHVLEAALAEVEAMIQKCEAELTAPELTVIGIESAGNKETSAETQQYAGDEESSGGPQECIEIS